MHSLATVHVFGVILASPAVRYLIGRFHLSELTGLAVDLAPLNAEGYFFFFSGAEVYKYMIHVISDRSA